MGTHGNDFRLYVDPFLLAEIALSVTRNALSRAWSDEARNTERKVLVRVIHHKESRSVNLDIADNGSGFDPNEVTWEDSNFGQLERKFKGWGSLQVLTRHNNQLLRFQADRIEKDTWPDADFWTTTPPELGTLVRFQLRYKYYWEFRQ
jgi:hypothetical protein